MNEKEFMEYVDLVSKEASEQMERMPDIPAYIRDFQEQTEEYDFLIVTDRVKFLKRYRDVWPENEVHHSYQHRRQAAKTKHHFHEGKLELIYLVKGEAVNFVGSREIAMKQGDLCLMGKSAYHGIALSDDAVVLNMLVRPECLKDLIRKKSLPSCSMEKFFARNLQEKEDHTVLLQSLEGRLTAYNLIQNLLEISRMDLPNKKLLMEQTGVNFLVYLICQNAQAEAFENEENQAELDIFHIYEYISRHYLTASLSSMAEEFHYSTSVLSKIIKKETGLTFSMITRKMKLEKSQELLANTQIKIEEIADYLNYSNRFSYERAFREMFGLSPKEYRESLF